MIREGVTEMIKRNKVMALIMVVMLVVTAAALTACNKASGNDSTGQGGSSVAGKCYVLSGMSSEDGPYDEETIKEMFDIDDISEYMAVYFGKDGKARLSSLLYKDEVLENDYKENGDNITIDMEELDDMSFTVNEDGTLSTIYVDDDNDFPLTMTETDKFPELLKEYEGK